MRTIQETVMRRQPATIICDAARLRAPPPAGVVERIVKDRRGPRPRINLCGF